MTIKKAIITAATAGMLGLSLGGVALASGGENPPPGTRGETVTVYPGEIDVPPPAPDICGGIPCLQIFE